jgi:pimeloyl-ACP methyl ester carboxylesterase
VEARILRVGPSGVRVGVTQYGVRDDHPIVLLHGIPGHRGTWHEIATRLARDHWVIAPDLQGFGDSETDGPSIHAGSQARNLLRLLDVLGVTQAVVVGFDFGGPTALRLIGAAPARVSGLVLANTNAFTDTFIPPPMRLLKLPAVGEVLSHAFFGGLGLTMLWLGAVRDRRAFPWESYRRMLKVRGVVETTRRLMLMSMRDLPGLYREVEQVLPTVSVPATVVWGLADPFFSESVGRRTAEAIRDARFIGLPGCGHFVPRERPDELISAIEDTYTRAAARIRSADSSALGSPLVASSAD